MEARAIKNLLLCCALGVVLSACAAGKKSTPLTHKPSVSPAERLAIKHYKLGIDSYANSRYSEAISHWKVTLANDPQNPNAAEYIARAENMIKVTKTGKKASN